MCFVGFRAKVTLSKVTTVHQLQKTKRFFYFIYSVWTFYRSLFSLRVLPGTSFHSARRGRCFSKNRRLIIAISGKTSTVLVWKFDDESCVPAGAPVAAAPTWRPYTGEAGGEAKSEAEGPSAEGKDHVM